MAGAEGAVEVDAGGDTTCIRRANGEVACWGDDVHGQASGHREPGIVHRDRPVTIAGISAAQIAIDDGRSYARLGDGAVWSWGVLPNGQVTAPAPVAGITGATSIVAGWGGAACAFSADHVPSCWGSTILEEKDRPGMTPVRVPWMAHTRLAFGGGNHCLVRDGGELACWGYNSHGGTGTGDARPFWAPRRVELRAADVALGDDFGCAISTDDTIACWGLNAFGQLGNGSRTSSVTPVPAPNSPRSP